MFTLRKQEEKLKSSVRSVLKCFLVIFCGFLLIHGSLTLSNADSPQIRVFAAASLTNAITELSEMYAKKNSIKVVPSFASSSTLAKQIENGAPADVFLSADLQWMDYLADKKALVEGTRFNLLGNKLVLISPASSDVKITIAPGLDLAKYLGNGRLATGDPDHVPAGKYAKSALEKLGMWPFVADKLARASDVRSALAWVEKGEAPLGIVYSTDAAVSKQVRVVAYFPDDSYPPIVYPAALLKSNTEPKAKDFLNYLKSDEAKKVFEKFGFTMK